MRFKVDENVATEAIGVLLAAGYDATTVFEQALGGRADRDIASVCKREGRILITLDTDFSDIRTYRPSDCPGLIVLRLPKQSAAEVVRMMGRLLEVFRSDQCRGQLWIVEPQRIRVRS
jgi:predicted nuclease of predicted toxin-antitoxin system